jgi:hypothetical protein
MRGWMVHLKKTHEEEKTHNVTKEDDESLVEIPVEFGASPMQDEFVFCMVGKLQQVNWMWGLQAEQEVDCADDVADGCADVLDHWCNTDEDFVEGHDRGGGDEAAAVDNDDDATMNTLKEEAEDARNRGKIVRDKEDAENAEEAAVADSIGQNEIQCVAEWGTSLCCYCCKTFKLNISKAIIIH